MARPGPISMALPPFRGTTRKLILANLYTFFGIALLGFFARGSAGTVIAYAALTPASLFHGALWQLLTYTFLPMGILGSLFAMLTLWFTGNYLEDHFGSRWLLEFYLVCASAGALLASLLTLPRFMQAAGVVPQASALGAWPAILALMVAFAILAGDQELRLFFVLRVKAKYMVAIYVLISLAVLLRGGDRFGALTELCCALTGFLYLKLLPRRGLSAGLSERYFGLRNDYYRWKRRRAARKFSVYMKKQNRDVHFDADGRYVDPDEARRQDTGRGSTPNPNTDPNDKRWMN